MGYIGVVYTEPNIILVWHNMGYMGAVYSEPNIILLWDNMGYMGAVCLTKLNISLR